MRKMAAGLAVMLGCTACAGPKVTPLDVQIAQAQSEATQSCYAAEVAKAQAKTAVQYPDARDQALVVMADALAGRDKQDPCANRGMNVYESRVRIAEAQNKSAANITRDVLSGAALVTGIVATADVLNNALKNAGHNTTTTVGDNANARVDNSQHITQSESTALGDNSPASSTASPNTTQDNVTTTTVHEAPAETPVAPAP